MAPCDRSFDELTASEKTIISEKMCPRAASYLGFLDFYDDLNEVVARDIERLKNYGISAKKITDALTVVVGRHHRFQDLYGINGFKCKPFSQKYPGQFEMLEGKLFGRSETDVSSQDWSMENKRYSLVTFNGIELMVVCVTWTQAQRCPFKPYDQNYHGDNFGKKDYCVYNPSSGVSVMFNDLNLHMAECHDFWEGNTMYRLDPIAAVECLMLRPDTTFRTTPVIKISWMVRFSGFLDCTEADVDYASIIRRWALSEGADVINKDGVIGFISKRVRPSNLNDEMQKDIYNVQNLHCYISDNAEGTIKIAGAELKITQINRRKLQTLRKTRKTYYPLETETV